MNLLIVSATKLEIQPFLSENNITWKTTNLACCKLNNYNASILITGVGAAATIYALTKLILSEKFEALIHIGICGHYGDNLSVGDVVRIKSDRFADLGIDNKGNFSSLFQMGFLGENEFPFHDSKLIASDLEFWNEELKEICCVDGLTVNTATGSKERATQLSALCPHGVETMESAAFMYVAINESVPFVSLRGVSNKVEERNFSSWNIPLAVKNINILLHNLLKKKTASGYTSSL